jgi:hypothetical protein
MASVELIGLHHREGPIVIAFITAIWCKALTALPASALRGHLLQEASAQISGIKSSNGEELKGSQISVAIGRAVCGSSQATNTGLTPRSIARRRFPVVPH